MSPILTRPVREQLEHDRVIRQLQPKYKRKTDVVINPGNEQNQSVTVGELVVFPDVLVFAEGTKRLLITVEVETGESVNSIEARAEWGVYSKLKVPLHLYVPPQCVEPVRRICDEYQIMVSELWTYTTSFDQVRFTMVHRSPDAPTVKVPAAKSAPAPKPVTALRQAQGRPEPGRGTNAKPAAKPKPAATPRQSQGRPDLLRAQSKGEQSRATNAKPKAKAVAKKSKPAAKPTLRQAQGRPRAQSRVEQSRGAKAKAAKKVKRR